MKVHKDWGIISLSQTLLQRVGEGLEGTAQEIWLAVRRSTLRDQKRDISTLSPKWRSRRIEEWSLCLGSYKQEGVWQRGCLEEDKREEASSDWNVSLLLSATPNINERMSTCGWEYAKKNRSWPTYHNLTTEHHVKRRKHTYHHVFVYIEIGTIA